MCWFWFSLNETVYGVFVLVEAFTVKAFLQYILIIYTCITLFNFEMHVL